MKRNKFTAIVLALLLLTFFAFPASAAKGYVTDQTGSIDQETLERLDTYAYEISKEYNCGVYFVMVDSYTVYTKDSEEDIIDATANYYHDNALGEGDGRDGMLILLSKSDRVLGSYVYGERAEYALDVYGQMCMEDAALVGFQISDWDMGVEDYLTACEEAFAAARNGEPLRDNYVGEIGLIYVIAFAISLGICWSNYGKHKSAKLQTEAMLYVTEGGLNLTESRDQFIRTTVTRVKKDNDSDSDSGESRRVQGGSGRSRSF